MKKLIYCAVPSRIKDLSEKIMNFVTSQGEGPLNPFYALPVKKFEEGSIGRKKSLEFTKRLVKICDEFYLFGLSHGTVVNDLKEAKINNIPIKYFFKEFDPEWKKYYNQFKKYIK